MGKKKTFLVDNSPVDVEEQDVNDFLKYNKGAVEARSYIVGKDTVDVALTDVADFEANVKNAKPLYGEEPKQVDPYAPKPVNFGKTTSVSPIVPEQPKTVTNDQKNRAKNYGDVVGQIKNMQSELTTINNREDSENSSIFLSAESDKQKAELEKNIALYNKAISTNVAQHTKDLYEKWDKEITDITPYTTTASVGGVTVHDTEKTFAEADKLAKEYGQEGTDFNTFVKLAFSQYVENRISQPTIDKYANEAFKEITQIDKSIPETAQEDFEQGFKERGTIIGKAKAEMDVVANTVKAEYAPEKEQLKQDATHISEDFWKDTQQYEMDYTAMQWQLNNEYQQGKVSREQYEAASAQAHETYKAGFEERQKESIQASAILAKTERDINLKIQRTYNQRRDMLIRSYDNSLQEAAKKYSAKYKSSPEFEANVKKAYDIAYARYSKERESALKQDMDMKGVVGMGTNTAWGMKNFGLAVTESIGNSIRSHGIMWNNASMISIGDEMATNIQLPESKIRTDQIMSDLFSYRGLLTAGQITGSGLPGIVVGAASAAVGNVAGMSQGLVAAVGGVIALGQETDDMATAMYAETMAETGNAATASEKAKQIVKGQSIMIIPSILHMTSFMKGINFGIKNKTLSYAAKATGELGTNIFEENYQNPMEEAVRKKGNWTMMGEYITKQGIIETTVNTLPMLGQTLMTTRADGEVKGVDIKVQADKFISDNKLSEILANRGDSFAQKELNDIQTVMGDNFALTTVQQMYTQGLIDDKKLNSLTAAVATNNQITKQIEGLKLNPEQGLIYRALVHKQTEAANGMADATSDVEKNYFATQEQNISSQLKLLAEGKDADVLMVTFPNGSQHILTTAEANQMLTDPDFIEQVKQGKAVDIKGYGKGAAEIKANLSKLEDMLVKEKEDKATQEAQSTLDNNVTQTETKPKTAEERAAAILAQVKRKPKTEAEALQAELKTVSDQEERTNIGEQITLHETKAQHEGKVKEIADKIVNLSENGKVVENLDKINALAADKKKIEESISDIENQIKTKQNERETKNKGREKASLLKEKTWHDLAKDDRITVNGVGASVSGVNQNMNGAVHSIDFTLDDGTKGVATILGNDILDANGKPLLIKNEVIQSDTDNQKPTESSGGVGGDVPALKDSKGDITYYSGRQSDNNDINRMGGKYNGVYFTPDIEQAEAYSAGKIIKGTIHPQKVFDFTEQIYKPRSEGESNKYIEAWEKDKKELGEDRMAHEHIGTNLYNQLIKDGYDVGVLDAKNLDTKRWGNTFNELVVLKNLDKIFKEQSLKETTKAETKVTSDNQTQKGKATSDNVNQSEKGEQKTKQNDNTTDKGRPTKGDRGVQDEASGVGDGVPTKKEEAAAKGEAEQGAKKGEDVKQSTSDKKSIEKVKVKDLEVGDEVVLKGKEGTWKVAKKTKDGVDLSHTTKQGSMFKGADDGDIEGKVVNRSENAVNGIKSAWESNIEALVNPETGLAAVIGRIVDETQPIKDAFLKRKGLTLEDYRILSFDEKEKLQAEWIKSNEFEQLQSRNEDQSTSEGKVVNRSENVTQSESLKETTKAETTSDKKSDGEPTSDNVILSEKSDATIKYNNLIKAIEKLKAENPKEFKKDGTPKSNSKILPSYKALADMATQAYEDSYLERQAQRRKEAKVIADKKDTGLVDGMANIASNSNAAQLFKTAMSKGVFNESEYNQIGTELALLPKDKNGQVDIRDVAEIVQSYFDNTVRPEKNEAQKKETEAINKAFEERQAELSKNLTPEQIQEEKEFDEINRIFAKVQSDETPTKKEIDYVNQNAWIPKGFVFGKNGLEEKSTSDNNVKQSEQKVTAVRQNGKTIIDENGNLTDELPNQFEKLKSEKDFKGLNELYSTVRIFLNGVAQSKGEKTVQQFQKLKKDIEDYANEVKEQSTSDNNINPSKPQPDAFDKAADATIAALNKYKILDTKSTDKKMGFGGDGEKIIRAAFDASRVIYHTTKSLAEAIKKALKTVRDSDWYKNLSGDQKSEIDSLVRKQLNDYAKENVVAEPLEELDLDMQDQAVKDQIMIEAQNLITTEDFKDAKEFSLRLKELYGIKETDAKAIYDKLVDFINVQTEDPFKIALRGKGAVTDHMSNKTINESSEDEIGNRTYLANSFDEMNEDIDAVFGRIKAANPNNWEKIIADKILKKLDERDMQAAIFADRFVTYLNTYLADHQRSPNYTAKALEYKGYRREILARRQKFTQEYATYFAALQQLKINNPLTLIKESGMLTAAERQAAKEMDEKLKGKKEYDASGKKKPFVEDSALDKAAPTSDKKGKSTSDKKDKPPTEKQAKKASRSEVKKNVLNALKNIKNNAADLAIKITKIPC